MAIRKLATKDEDSWLLQSHDDHNLQDVFNAIWKIVERIALSGDSEERIAELKVMFNAGDEMSAAMGRVSGPGLLNIKSY